MNWSERTSTKEERIAWLAELSRARRSSRRLAAKYGDTIYLEREVPEFHFVPETVGGKPSKRRKNKIVSYVSQVKNGVQIRAYLRSYRKSARKLFEQLSEAQGGVCYLCHEAFSDDPLSGSLDHVVPQSKGGGDSGNLLAAHKTCNGRKSDRMPTDDELAYLAKINARLPPAVGEMLPSPKKAAKNAAFMEAVEQARIDRLASLNA